METQFTFANYIVACTNDSCENFNLDIEVTAVETNPFVICGPCSAQITKIVPV
jgi:hypothetical protein